MNLKKHIKIIIIIITIIVVCFLLAAVAAGGFKLGYSLGHIRMEESMKAHFCMDGIGRVLKLVQMLLCYIITMKGRKLTDIWQD